MKTAIDDRVEKDIKFLAHPDNWPNWPMCPVKRKEDMSHPFSCGVVISLYPKRVYQLNMFNMPKGPKTWDEALTGVHYEEYETVEQLTAVWAVD